jgi:hypothetical protein
MTFGYCVVLKLSFFHHYRAYYLCKCICRVEREICKYDLAHGRSSVAWSDLEISYAMMCDQGVSVLDAAGRAAVNDSLVDLKRLVQGALDEVGTDE